MFTGIVEEIGTVEKITLVGNFAKIDINAKKVLKDIEIGDSIATNGVCLTVIKLNKSSFTADIMEETLNKSNLKNLKKGDKVNLERALKLTDRLNGHIVSGHIDGVGFVEKVDKKDNAIWLTVNAEVNLIKYIIYKGSITIDGVSLTVAEVESNTFKVSIIPHTQMNSIITKKKIGSKVNLECDLVGKYIEKFMNFNGTGNKKHGINIEFLSKNGFL